MRVCWSASRAVHHNLALEEWWMDHFAAMGPLLLFYVNEPALVVGKNQNPWREAATGWARREGVPFGRRISGGGTVYHDGGNLNFSLIVARGQYEQGTVFEKTVAALRDLGLAASVHRGNSLAVHGKKISGTAFCFRGPAAMHHGTLLVQSDLERLRRALIPALPEVETRAIASNPASVANAATLMPGLTMHAVARSLASRLAGVTTWEDMTTLSDPAYQELLAKHQRWDWIYGHTPAFTWSMESQDARLHLRVERGVVASVSIVWRAGRQEALPALVGSRFDADALAARSAGTEWASLVEAREF